MNNCDIDIILPMVISIIVAAVAVVVTIGIAQANTKKQCDLAERIIIENTVYSCTRLEKGH